MDILWKYIEPALFMQLTDSSLAETAPHGHHSGLWPLQVHLLKSILHLHTLDPQRGRPQSVAAEFMEQKPEVAMQHNLDIPQVLWMSRCLLALRPCPLGLWWMWQPSKCLLGHSSLVLICNAGFLCSLLSLYHIFPWPPLQYSPQTHLSIVLGFKKYFIVQNSRFHYVIFKHVGKAPQLYWLHSSSLMHSIYPFHQL